MTTIGTAALWQPGGWSGPVALDLADGRIRRSQALEPAAATNASWLLPGIPNLHSHAFQRAMAGFAERRSAGQGNDSFWTWRETMYAFAARMTPETLYAVACQLYVEMLEAGYTWVCEFHYLHHQADGRAYDDPAAMSKALIAAAADTGIGLTLLPVLYMSAGFDGSPLAPRQRRFGHDLEAYLRLLSSLQGLQCDRLRLGAALHSLRAVPPQALSGLMESEVCDEMPIHIHIAEQPAEVAECLAVRGARPVQWL
ncbi:MAG: amidohydrolase family protein, partial [Lysobacterales bacterium]